MYRLLIVDDEPVIADGLYDLVCEASGSELDVYKAYSGNKALDLAKKLKMDIVLTDIFIPDMSGLDICTKIREIWPGCRFIFLSGHSDPEYIQFAVRNDAVDYIIKNEGDEAILHAVAKAVDGLDQDINTEQLLEKAKESVNLAVPLLRWKCLNGFLEEEDYSAGEMEKQFADYGIPLDIRMPVLLFAGKTDVWPDGAGKSDNIRLMYGIQHIVHEYLSKEMRIVSIAHERSWMVWFVQPPPEGAAAQESWERVLLCINGTMDQIQETCRHMYNISVSFALHAKTVEWSSVGAAFELLRMSLNQGTDLHSKLLLVNSAAERSTGTSPNELPADMEDEVLSQLRKIGKLEAMLESGQRNEFAGTFQAMMQSIERLPDIHSHLGMEAYYALANMFLSGLNRWKLAGPVGEKINLGILMKIEAHASWNDIARYFLSLAECVFDERNDEHLYHVDRIFRLLKTYIEQHLDGDLSLLRLSEILHLNPSYLSRLFKQITGESLTEYIAETKLKKARELLGHSHLKINEVASAVGFDTQSYFTRFFKKNTGLTPQKYREHVKSAEGPGRM